MKKGIRLDVLFLCNLPFENATYISCNAPYRFSVEMEKTAVYDSLKQMEVQTMNAIKVNNLTKCYGEVTAVNHISFELEKGRMLGFLGVNGAGKKTKPSGRR